MPTIREILANAGPLTNSEAEELQGDLRTWLVRFSKRPSTHESKLEALLLAAASQFSREYRRLALEVSAPATEK